VASGEETPDLVTMLSSDVDGGTLGYIGVNELPRNSEGPLSKALQVLVRWGSRTVNWLDRQSSRPSHVVVYGGNAQYMFYLSRWCKRNKVPLIVDVVEWYSPQQLIGGFFGPSHLGVKLALRYQYPRADGIIAISSLLESYYRQRGCRVIRIPPTMDVQNLALKEPTDRADDRISLVYAGTPGKKDLLEHVILGVEQVDAAGKLLELRIVGPTLSQVSELLKNRALPQSVKVLGRLSQQDVSTVLQASDFSVLLRKPKRFAHAGFPTKFCESLANGTPVIANITGDLGTYLRDGHEGLVSPDHSVASFAHTLRRALELSRRDRDAMRSSARLQATQSFDFRRYTEEVDEFFSAG
jgi:glycosyltransferase involved in cell wall biosynthesis